jgi:AcrR family transcriptional regulator
LPWARPHLAAAGFEGFSVAPLSKTAGRSRAALYLYFANREEVLLALYLEETRAWLEELTEVTAPDMAIDGYLRAVFSSAARCPPFMELAPLVAGAVESNVLIERLIESKRFAATLVDRAGRRTSLALGLPVEQGAELAVGLFARMLGVAQALQTPDVDLTRLPPDVQALVGGEAPVDALLDESRRPGARAGVGGCFNDERSCSGSHWRRLSRGIVQAPL